MNLHDLIASGANIQLQVDAADLREFGRSILEDFKKQDQEKVIDTVKEPAYITTDEACSLLMVKPITLWRWAQNGYLVPKKVGVKNRYLRSEVIAIIHGSQK